MTDLELIAYDIDGSPGDLYDPPPHPPLRLPCGSLRSHGPHAWIGQTTGDTYRCAGVVPRGVSQERGREADRRLREENAGITDSWSEEH